MDLAVCLWAVLPGAILWGASFPLALAAAAGPTQDPGRLVAGVYAANTVGAISGALAFSLVFIPVIGTQWSQRLLLALAATSAAVVLAPLLRSRARPPRLSPARPAAAKLSAIGLAAAAAFVPLMAWSISPMPWAAVGFGRFCATMIPEVYPGVLDQEEIELLKRAEVWRITLRIVNGAVQYEPQVGGRPGETLTAAIRSSVDAWIADHESELLAALRKGRQLGGEGPSSAAAGGGAVTRYCAFLGEGVNVSVAVSESTDGFRCFHGAGKVQASTEPADMRLQRMLGHLSMLARSDPASARSVLVVACGAGVTAGSFVPYESVERIVLCDIEPMVLKRVAPMFAAENNNVLDDRRTQVVVDDGRHLVRTTKETFDVITSDPLDPWIKGCAALNTREYYEMCKARLNPGGVMTLWVPLYESDWETARTFIATFFQVFPNGVLWSNEAEGEGYDAVLLGWVDPVGKINVDDLQDWLDRHPAVAGSLEEAGFGSGRLPTEDYGETCELSVDLLATYAGQARDMAGWLQGAQINTDRNLRLQYLAGMALNRYLGGRLLRDILAYYRFPDNLIEGSEARLAALEEQMAQSGRHPPARDAW
ncbi:MAG: hypothetical protein AMK73_06715 [Planctomycetes bacterium SM23_32]|nr:MAG: hypothetical protein AMK73_06715 [Planctomycetes bacterium SM23_32]